MSRGEKPGLGQGRDTRIITGAISEPGPPWRDRTWRMRRREKPGLGQGLGQGEIFVVKPTGSGRFLPEPALSEDTKIPRFARNDRREGVEMTEKAMNPELSR